MSSRGTAPSNNAFAGGAQQRNLYPPGVGGANLSANTRVSSPAAGVAPGQIKSALNNSTSNIGIPYSRLVPLNNSNKLIGVDAMGKTVTRKETEDLRATHLAFILGIRGDSKPPRPLLVGNEQAPGIPGYNVAYQPEIMPAMVGTERFQQLCSMEYLHEYFKQVLGGKTIALDQSYEAAKKGMPDGIKTTGPIGALAASISEATLANIPQGAPGRASVGAAASMLAMPDLAVQMGLRDSDARRAPPNYQGIFARDFGPFLKGKGSATELVDCTAHNLPQVFNPGAAPDDQKTAQPFAVSRNFGDEVAFAVLDAKLLEKGLTDWRPDGIVLSKGVNDPSDQLSNEYLEARDGQLFNIRIQGPAIGTAWTGERSLEVLPLDKVFVVIVADVWFDAKSATKYDASVEAGPDGRGGRTSATTIASLMAKGIETTDDVKEYQVLRAKYMSEPLDEEAFQAKQVEAFRGTVKENTVLANFRVMVSTSSQMINHSTFKTKGNQTSDTSGKRRKLIGGSRMSLTLSNDVGEYIVGGWQIGNVLDTAASRGSMPQGANLGIRSSPNSAAMNINVNVSWFNADRLCRSFNNPEGVVKQRFEGIPSYPKNPVNLQADSAAFDKAAGVAVQAEA
jgi:hypothetical protein